uniref:inositol-polyphosphate 5-phosphatase n=1 Tax=Macrostomum lignano TaxID=282301 RepID=A0A1I8IQR0_9PLAT
STAVPLRAVGEVEKRKFPLKFFPNQVLSRKGYMRTRWRAGVATFDLVNVHLFHDAIKPGRLTPSVYARHRRDALMWILDQLRSGPPVKDEFAIAASSGSGVKGVEDGGESLSAERLPTVTQKCRRTEQRDKDGHLSIEYYRGDDRVLTVGKKQFHSCTHSREFFENKHIWLGQLDFEPSSFDSSLFEFPVTFPPTYPFSEGASERDATEYMATRLPAWCDRVLCSSSARSAILCPPEDPTQYGVLGLQDCMGDHKPVYLYTLLCYGASAAVHGSWGSDRCAGAARFSGPTRSHLTRSGLTRSGLTRSGLTRSGLTRSGLTRSGLTRSGLTHSGLTRSGLTCSGLTLSGLTQTFWVEYIAKQAVQAVQQDGSRAEPEQQTVSQVARAQRLFVAAPDVTRQQDEAQEATAVQKDQQGVEDDPFDVIVLVLEANKGGTGH